VRKYFKGNIKSKVSFLGIKEKILIAGYKRKKTQEQGLCILCFEGAKEGLRWNRIMYTKQPFLYQNRGA